MTNPFDGVFDAPTPSSLEGSAIQSVQSSLYQRLKKTRGDKAGGVAWLLVRLGQDSNPKHAAAREASLQLSADAVGVLRDVAMKTCAAPSVVTKPKALALARAIVGALDELGGMKRSSKPEPKPTRDEFGGPASMARMSASHRATVALMAQGYGEEEACAMVKAENLKAGDGASE